MSLVEAIARKRDGLRLTDRQIAEFVAGASRGTAPPEQLAAMLMAICWRGMSDEETRRLTEEMLASGERWQLAEVRPGVVDKHSTGGVGDTVSLVFAPLLASLGVPVAMMAGRGLGHTQGTIDKLEAVPGFRCRRGRDEVLGLIDSCGAAIVEQSDRIAPADRALYALRDVTATVPSLPLITSSIMSKKLAFGAAVLVLDVTWGRGAFAKTVAEATELGRSLCRVADATGVAVQALISDMNQPVGRALGTACEVRAALDVLAGVGSRRLRQVTVRLAREALMLAGWRADRADRELDSALDDGRALEAWRRIVTAHGGDPDPERLARPLRTAEVAAKQAGFVTGIDGERLGWVAGELGAGRRTLDEPLAHAAGLEVHARLGDRVEVGQPLARILFGERDVDRDEAVRRVGAAFEIDADRVDPPALMLGTLDELDGGA